MQYLKHYYETDGTGGKSHPPIEGLDVKYWCSDDEGVDYCLSVCPDEESLDTEPVTYRYRVNRPSTTVLTKAQWNAEVATHESRLLARRWNDIRAIRNQLLADTDWRALSDLTLSAGWATYRQELRDLPLSVENPDDVVFPTDPNGHQYVVPVRDIL